MTAGPITCPTRPTGKPAGRKLRRWMTLHPSTNAPTTGAAAKKPVRLSTQWPFTLHKGLAEGAGKPASP